MLASDNKRCEMARLNKGGHLCLIIHAEGWSGVHLKSSLSV